MPKYEVYFKSSAEKELYRLDSKLIKLVLSKIELLSFNPRGKGAIKLKGNVSYRYRIGDYRIIYEIDEIRKIVTVFRIRHRKDVYRGF
ncbi:MAG: hypothetical protein A3B68_03240 [Candidatus Melainabacteria bacterium RIFCSPHIGHO2_02_FULL_34_12]|nr:MAG: hypothetical protein A3B68_03240 [Candidatus Melainabacteria bacterium RIFCSPHIGHO2_02_FULL_34_12]